MKCSSQSLDADSQKPSFYNLYQANHSELKEYVKFLNSPSLRQIMNDAFETQNNTMKATKELQDYYISRPTLKSYTLEKELSCYGYCVHCDERHTPLRETSIIEDLFHGVSHSEEEDLVLRAANLSLIDTALST